MVGLLDIAEASPETVDVRGSQISVNGLSAQQIVKILHRFEELPKLLDGSTMFTPKIILDAGPDVIAAVIAAGTGAMGDERVEQKALTLSVGEQYDLVAKIVELTFGKNMGPFAERVRALWAAAGAEPSVAVDPGKVPSSTSRPRSRASLRSATTPEMFGAIPRANSTATPN